MLSPLTIVSLDQGKLYGPGPVKRRPQPDTCPVQVELAGAGRHARLVALAGHLIRQLREWRAAGKLRPGAVTARLRVQAD